MGDNEKSPISSPTFEEVSASVSPSARSPVTSSVVSTSPVTSVTDCSTRAENLTEPTVAPPSSPATMSTSTMPADGTVDADIAGRIDDLKAVLLREVFAEKLQLRLKIEIIEEGIELLCLESAYLRQHATKEVLDGWQDRRIELEREKNFNKKLM